MFKRLICLVILLMSVAMPSVAENGFGRFGQSADSYLREQKQRRAAEPSKRKSPYQEEREARRTHGRKREGELLALLVLLVGWALYGAYSSVKGSIAAQKYDAKNRNRYSCSYCGRTYGTHAVYHSVSKTKKLDGKNVQVKRGGFAIYTCRTCLLRHRLRYALWRLAVVILCLVGFYVFLGLTMSCAFQYGNRTVFFVYLCLFMVFTAIVYWGFRLVERHFAAFLFPWRTLASGNPVIAAFLAKGYEIKKERPHLVRDGVDTSDCQKEEEHSTKYSSWTEHLTYRWMGALRDFGQGEQDEPTAAAALRFLTKKSGGSRRRTKSCRRAR